MTYVYRQFDQTTLDREYNNRASVPNFDERMSTWLAQESIVKASTPCLENISYGELEQEKLDLYPAANTNSPVFVFLHGGDFSKLEKGHSAFPATNLVQAGVSYIAADFPMRPTHTITQIRHSIRKLIRWIWDNAAGYGINPNQIYIGGSSSGSNLCCQLLMTDWELIGVPQSVIKGAVLLGPLADWAPVRLTYRQRYLNLTDEEVEFMSVVRYQGKFVNCPMIVINGSSELSEYQRQGKWLADEWASRGNKVSMLVLPEHDHFNIIDTWADSASEPFRETINMIKGTQNDSMG